MQNFLMEAPVRLIARLVRSEALNNDDLVLPNANRISFEFDAIDAGLNAEEALATLEDRGDRTRLAVLKILTTAENFQDIANVANIHDGQWYQISLLPRGKKSGAYAWASSLGESGYSETVPLVLDAARYLFSEGDLPLKPIGATVENERALAQLIADACTFPKSAIGKSRKAAILLRGLHTPYRIVVRDVGQASFCTAIDDHGDDLFHLDAGWPISYNLKTVARKPKLRISDVPVILTHWDWDHLHGYHAIMGLAGGVWVAPVQRLGPGARLVAQKLARDHRLLGVSSANLSAGSLRIGRCKGKAGDLNQTGVCVQITLTSGNLVLFMGDADYYLVRPRLTKLPDFIVATHHGAKFTGSVVLPNGGRGCCVVSVGKGNGYGHPSDAAIVSHENVGWSMRFTCEHNHASRGSRHLGP